MVKRGRSVLVVDDDRFIQKIITTILKESGLFSNFLTASNGYEGLKILKERGNEIDLVFCDLNMPDFDGLKFLEAKEKLKELKDIPVIILTAAEEKELKLKALELGANDFITKPADPAEIIARARVQLKIKQLQDELKKQNRILKELSNTDPLTKIYNRRHFMDLLDREFARSMRYGRPLSLAIVDIDHFKMVNDTYGHQIGDRVLIEFVKRIKEGLRKHDVLGRYGGEEFTILLPETKLSDAVKVIERHRKNMDEKPVLLEPWIHVTFSAGVTGIPDVEAESVDDMIKQADLALYNAKNSGRNRVISYKEVTENPLKNNS